MRTGRPRDTVQSLTPLHLRAVLERSRISHARMRAVMHYPNGKPLSGTAFSLLINRNLWPVTVQMPQAKEAAEAFLRGEGVQEADLAQLWRTELQPIAPEKLAAKPGTEVTEALQLPEHAMLSSAAKQHFKLLRNPFLDDVTSPEDVFLSADQRYVRDSMYYAARHGGFIAVIGESGSGKSTLRRDLVDRLRRDNEPIVVIHPQTVDKTMLTASHICQAIIADLSQEHPKRSAESQTRQIQRILAGSMRAGNTHVLVIEEAHDLSVATLKYLKRFWELEEGFKKLLGIILIGQPELGDRLDERRNYEAREVIRRCEVARLVPLNGNLEAYLALKFKRIGREASDVMEANSYDAIRTRLTISRSSKVVESDVYPLVVHNLLVRAMNQAAELGFPKVNAELISRV